MVPLFREIMTFLVQKVVRGLAGSCILLIFFKALVVSVVVVAVVRLFCHR